ncbi:MAG: SpoIID/LytB domain-containing protein [Calditrichia bacterium]
MRIKGLNNTARILSRWAAFFIFGAIILFSGCARQFRRPSPEGLPSRVPPVRVALDDNLSSGTLSFEGKYELKSEEATYILDASSGEFGVSYSNQKLVFSSSQRWFSYTHFQSIDFIPADGGKFVWNGVPYSGEISFRKENSRVAVVNVLPMTDYLKGVVPREIPSNSEDYKEAVKAQCIAARTYALYHLEHPAAADYDVFADSRDQVYMGLKGHSALSDEAVDKTLGTILKEANGRIVETQFHSTCGGILELKDDYGNDNHTGIINDVSGDSVNCSASPLYRWVEPLSTRTILKNLVKAGKLSGEKAAALAENGFEMSIQVRSRLASGRIKQLLIKLNDHSILLNEWQMRVVLSGDKSRILPSNLFFLKKSPRYTDRFYVIGAGFGHGRGMCQWGAIGQSLEGKNYKDILSFYYPALKLGKIY